MLNIQRRKYEVLVIKKPCPNGNGECKTDVYATIMTTESDTFDELKISVKQKYH